MDGPVTRTIKAIFYVGPLLFGLGFLAPLLAQTMAAAGVDAPFGMSRLSFGILAGLALGLFAQYRGRWI